MVMMWVDTVLYMIVAWYVDNINPGDAGVARKPWFLFMVCVIFLTIVNVFLSRYLQQKFSFYVASVIDIDFQSRASG